MHSLPYRSKISTVLGVSMQCVSHALEKGSSLWGTFGLYLCVLPAHYGHCENKFPDELMECDLTKVTHLVDGKDMKIETPRNNDSLKRRVRSEKFHESAARVLNFSTPIGLAFEHARMEGARASKKSI